MQNQKITIEVIESKEFHVAAMGYNQHEVDEFLDSICDELERMENEMATLQQQLAVARQTPVQEPAQTIAAPVVTAAPAAAPADSTFREILEMAQRVKEMTIADAENKAAEIVANAQNEITARLGNLEEEKETLTAEVEALKAAAKEYKEKFAALLAMGQEALDAAGEL